MYGLQEIEKGEWVFVEPKCVADCMDEFHEALDLREDGESAQAFVILNKIITKCPSNIDALHHLSMLYDRLRDEAESYRLEREAVSIGLDALEGRGRFNFESDKLEWGFIRNRPFLRAYHGLAIHLAKREENGEATIILERMLRINPNDNQGARCSLPSLYFASDNPQKVIDLYDKYNSGVELLFGSALASYKLNRLDEAKVQIEQAASIYTLCAEELVKKEHHKPYLIDPDYLVVGGEDQAYQFWQECGKFWEGTDGALDLVRDALGKSG